MLLHRPALQHGQRWFYLPGCLPPLLLDLDGPDRIALATRYWLRRVPCSKVLMPRSVVDLEFAFDAVSGVRTASRRSLWSRTPPRTSPNLLHDHEYVEVYAKDLKVSSQDERMFREPKPGSAELLKSPNKSPDYPTAGEIQRTIADLSSNTE